MLHEPVSCARNQCIGVIVTGAVKRSCDIGFIPSVRRHGMPPVFENTYFNFFQISKKTLFTFFQLACQKKSLAFILRNEFATSLFYAYFLLLVSY